MLESRNTTTMLVQWYKLMLFKNLLTEKFGENVTRLFQMGVSYLHTVVQLSSFTQQIQLYYKTSRPHCFDLNLQGSAGLENKL